MKWLRRYNESTEIRATDDAIRYIVRDEIRKLGNCSDLNHIDVSGVTSMNHLFWKSPFNGDISRWDVHNVKDMRSMFFGSLFNGDISNWNVSNVQNMSHMFYGSPFNGHISGWNFGNVTNMSHMFMYSRLDRDLSNWNVINLKYMYRMFYYSPLEGQEPWWYVFSPLFKGDNYSMFDSLDFGWINIEGKVIYRGKLIKTFKRGYNTEWNGELPPVWGFTYN